MFFSIKCASNNSSEQWTERNAHVWRHRHIINGWSILISKIKHLDMANGFVQVKKGQPNNIKKKLTFFLSFGYCLMQVAQWIGTPLIFFVDFFITLINRVTRFFYGWPWIARMSTVECRTQMDFIQLRCAYHYGCAAPFFPFFSSLIPMNDYPDETIMCDKLCYTDWMLKNRTTEHWDLQKTPTMQCHRTKQMNRVQKAFMMTFNGNLGVENSTHT